MKLFRPLLSVVAATSISLSTTVLLADPASCSEAVNSGYEIAGDVNEDCRVDLGDFRLLASNWLRCIEPADPDCDAPWIPVKDVTQFGATGDDQTDDTEAFVAALAGGGNVYVPAGTYRLTGLQIPSDTTFYGDGPASSFLEVTDAGGRITVESSCQVEDLHFTGVPNYEPGGSASGLIYVSALNVAFDNVAVEDYRNAGIEVHEGHHIEITNSHFEKLAWGMHIVSVKNVNVIDNRLIDIGQHGIQFWGNYNFQEMLCEDLVFKGNHITNVPGGAYLWGTGAKRVLMLNNIGDGGAGDVGFDLEWCYDSAIIGNYAENVRNAGIALFLSCKNIEIRENTVKVHSGPAGWVWGDLRLGIWLTATNTGIFPGDMGHENVSMTGNTVICEQATGRHAIAVGSTGPAGNIVTSANVLVNGDIYTHDSGSITNKVNTFVSWDLFNISAGHGALGVPGQYVWTHQPISDEELLTVTSRFQPSTNTILMKDPDQLNEDVMAIRHNIEISPSSGTVYVDSLRYGETAEAYANGDFEAGTYANWNVNGTAWGSAPVTESVGMSGQGLYWADSSVAGETAVGVLTSQSFTLQTNRIRVLQAGWPGQDDWGADAAWYSTQWTGNACRLKRTSDHEVLFVSSPPYNLDFRESVWNVGTHLGEQVYFQADDDNSGSIQAYFAVDGFQRTNVEAVDLSAHADGSGAIVTITLHDDPANLRVIEGQDYTLSIDAVPAQTQRGTSAASDVHVTFGDVSIPGTNTVSEVTIAVGPAQ